MKKSQDIKIKLKKYKKKKKEEEKQIEEYITKKKDDANLSQEQKTINKNPVTFNEEKKDLTEPSKYKEIIKKKKKDKKGKEKSKKSKKPKFKEKNKRKQDYSSLTDKERFQLGLQQFKQKLNELSLKYGVRPYLIIELLMMTIDKSIHFSYRNYARHYKPYMKELTTNLKIKFKLNSPQKVEIENLIHEVEEIFENFEFDLFQQFSKGRKSGECYSFEKTTLFVVYEEFKKLIIENISNFIEGLSNNQKGILFLLLFRLSKQKFNSFNMQDLKYIVILNKFFSKTNVDVDFIIKTYIKSGIGHFNFNNNMGIIYYFWRDIPNIKRILEETELPDFSEDITNFIQKFDFNTNKKNLLQYVAYDCVNDEGKISETNLDKITVQGTSKIVNFQNIIDFPYFNPFLKNELKEIIENVKKNIIQQFSWIELHIKTNLNGFLYNENRYGKAFYVKLRDEDFYIEIYAWYNEFFETYEWKEEYNKDRLIIFLYHPNFRFLKEEFYDSNLLRGILAFGDNKNSVFITPQSQKEKLIPFLELILEKQFQLNFLSKPEFLEYKQVFYTIPLIDDFWFFIDFEKNDLERLQISLGSKSPIALLLIAKNERMSLEDTIQNLFTDEYLRKIGKVEAEINSKSISDTDITTTILLSEKLRDNIQKRDIETRLNALSAEIDKSTDEGRKLLILKSSFL